jgi:PadR family transcriptional regulator, regulatory protein PadR
MSRKKRVLSESATAILAYFLKNPEAELYGFEILRQTGIGSGTLYPALRLLAEDRQFLVSRWEQIDPRVAGRPPRRFYRLDAEHASVAASAIEESGNRSMLRLPVPQAASS